MADPHLLEPRLAFVGLDAAARTRLQGLQDMIEAELPSALDVFYQRVRETPEARRHFRDESQIDPDATPAAAKDPDATPGAPPANPPKNSSDPPK